MWSKIELVLSICSIADFFIDIKFQWFHYYIHSTVTDKYFIYYRLLMIVRDFRILLIIQQFIGIQRLINVLNFTLVSLLKLLGILMMILTVYAFFGCELFGFIHKVGDGGG